MLHSQEKLILENLVNVIIPADRDLNGWSAGVGDYLSRQFAGDLREMLTIYQQGLNALDSEALIVYEHGFCVISNSQREALLRQIEAGNIQSDVPIDLTVFFKMVVEHAIEGYYSDPENGGNRAGVAWQMIGFEVTK